MAIIQEEQGCGCGTKNQALVWCWIHGYLTKPRPVKKKSRRSLEYKQAQMQLKNDLTSENRSASS